MSNKDVRGRVVIAGVVGGAFAALSYIGKKNQDKNEKGIDDWNEYLNFPSPSNDPGDGNNDNHRATGYEKIVKPAIDKLLSFTGLVLLSPVYAIVSLAIMIDDPGSVLFTQKRVVKGKHFFKMHKFRSMNIGTTNLHQYVSQHNQKSDFLAA